MWQKLMTLSIAIAMAGTALAQQNDPNAAVKKEQEAANREQQAVNEAIKARLDAQRALADAERAQVDARRAAVEADQTRAKSEQVRAQEAILEAQQRFAADQGVAANRTWTRFAAARATKKEKVTYCGVSTVEPPAVLIEQLKLTRGIGLVVDYVEPGSPAEAAGLKQYDVITKFNDQILSNAEQLGVLVRLKKFNDDAKLEVIRQGKTMSVNVELGQKEVEVEVENANAVQDQQLQFALRDNGQLAVTTRRPRLGVGGGGGGIAFTTNVAGNDQIAWSDDQYNLVLDMMNGKAIRMTAKDKAGKEVFNGPVVTQEQRKALPADLAEKLKKAEENGAAGFNTRFTRGGNVAPRARVFTSTERDTLLLVRIENGKATHAFAFSTTDGKTLFDGPTTTDEQRKAIPETVAKQLEELEKNPTAASEFGVAGRN